MLYNRKTLREITEIAYESEKQEKFYTAEATIKSIDTSDEWYYIGCGKCNKKLQKEGNHFYCPKCEKEPEKTCPRIFFMDSEEDSSVQHVNVEQNTTKGTKKSRTRNTCHVVH
uniref:Replication factor A C-terminal domain-containing protein n=1 Tax=Aegilops tauschii subsp. strangulata TaxID=200361 RepID=A0A453C8R6_AEGTS